MSRNRDELKKGLPKLESMLIDFLLDSGIGPKHIKGNIVLQYAPKIQELCDSITKIRQTALKEIYGGSETPEDLEEAAEKHLDTMFGKGKHQSFYKELFVAGGKWQADHTPLPEDTVIYNKGVAEGKRLMMEGAVEGEVYKFGEVAYVKERNNAELTKYLSQFNNGDKVKIIVIHETDIR